MNGINVLTFGVMLRKIRIEKGILLRDLAKRIGEYPSNLSNIENGVRQPWKRPDVYLELRKAMELSINEFESLMLLCPSYVEWKAILK